VIDRGEQVRRILELARDEAALLGHRYLGPEHILLGILRDAHSEAARILRAHGVDLEAAHAALAQLVDRDVVPGPRPSDAELFGMLGIDLRAIRRALDQTFSPQALEHATREATRARRKGIGRVPRTPLQDPPVLSGQTLVLTGEQARTLGYGEVGPELLLLGILRDVQTPWPRCTSNPWRQQLYASVGLPDDYRGAAGPLLAALGVDPERLVDVVSAELRPVMP
jgi:hypothetical protein